jgi:hypothetical protein
MSAPLIDPDDPLTLLIAADWYEERGDQAKADFLRSVECGEIDPVDSFWKILLKPNKQRKRNMSGNFQPGKYTATIIAHQLGVSSAKKTPQIAFEIEPTVRVIGDQEETCDKDHRTVFLFFTDGTIDQTCKQLKTLGYTDPSFDRLDPEAPNAHIFAGQTVHVEMKLETYNNEQRERWDFSGRGPLQIEKLDRKGIAGLNASFSSFLKGNGSRPATPAKPVAQGAPAAANEETI